jgi:hypothetical protein
MQPDFATPDGLVPQSLDAQDSRAYEEHTVDALRSHMMGSATGLVVMDAIELVGSRPETLVVFRYHHNPDHVARNADVMAGARAEAASLWDFAIDPDDAYSVGTMHTPPVLAGAIGSAFDAGELPPVDPATLKPIGRPPKVFPRLLSDANADLMRRKFEAWRSAQDEGR